MTGQAVMPRTPTLAAQVATPRWELLRALGALCLDDTADTVEVAQTLGLPAWARADHTAIFVLDLPPYASIHLGPDGKMGGEAADRVAGLWRTLHLDPPSDADHLGVLLALYAELGAASQACQTTAAAARLDHARAVVLWEHLWSWVPGYLAAVAQNPAGRPWATLTSRALMGEAAATPEPPARPVALRHAPAPPGPDDSLDELLDALTTTVRAGFVLTYTDVVRAGSEIGAGVRRGERRFALRSMMEQDPTATLRWLAGHARRWAQLHTEWPDRGAGTSRWWARRAHATLAALEAILARC